MNSGTAADIDDAGRWRRQMAAHQLLRARQLERPAAVQQPLELVATIVVRPYSRID
jgi:hypothetical protein